MVGGSRVYSSGKVAEVTARGPVPPSTASPCTHIGGGNVPERRPCPHQLIHDDDDDVLRWLLLLIFE